MFDRALTTLSDEDRQRVELQFTAWSSTGGDWAQITINARGETALPEPEFVALLTDFVRHLTDGGDPQMSWVRACRGRHFRGAVLGDELRPRLLGRALALEDYAKRVSEISGLSPETEKRLLRQYAGSSVPGHRLRNLRRTALGAYVLWATFDPTRAEVDPFRDVPKTTPAVRSILGLGRTAANEVLALVTYRCPLEIALHRPTIAEAGDYAWYRPHDIPDHPHGYTCRLDTGARGLPEVVHRPPGASQSLDLVLPYHLTEPS